MFLRHNLTNQSGWEICLTRPEIQSSLDHIWVNIMHCPTEANVFNKGQWPPYIHCPEATTRPIRMLTMAVKRKSDWYTWSPIQDETSYLKALSQAQKVLKTLCFSVNAR